MSHTNLNVDDYVRWVFSTPVAPGETAFFRGHSKADTYKLIPYALRTSENAKAEPRNYRELMIASPAEFRDDVSTFERLSRMQHYGLPTRMLDTSTNPLIALWFACQSHDDLDGEVIRLTIQDKQVKYFDSDTVSVLANIALLALDEREKLDTSLDRDAFNKSIPAIKLLHFIKREKPYFRDAIEPTDINRVLCVKAQHSNERVTAQSGAFLLFGHSAILPEEGNAELSIERFRIPAKGNAKARMREQLAALAIHKGTAYRDLGAHASFIASRT